MQLQSQETEKVQRIIALKRFEQPPPGYFHLLPDKIMSRLEQGEARQSIWERLLPMLTIRPAVAYAIGLTACGAVTVGTIYSTKLSAAAATEPMSEKTFAIGALDSVYDGGASSAHRLHVPNWLGSTNPVTTMRAHSSYAGAPDTRFIAVNYSIGN